METWHRAVSSRFVLFNGFCFRYIGSVFKDFFFLIGIRYWFTGSGDRVVRFGFFFFFWESVQNAFRIFHINFGTKSHAF